MAATKAAGKKPAAKKPAARKAAQKPKQSASTELVKRAPKEALAKRAAANALPAAGKAVQGVARAARGAVESVVARGGSRLPIQRSVDVAVPVEVAWDEWM